MNCADDLAAIFANAKVVIAAGYSGCWIANAGQSMLLLLLLWANSDSDLQLDAT